VRPAKERSALSRLLPVGLVLVSLTGCARAPSTALRDPRVELPGFRPGPISTLSPDQVAADALDREELTTLLETNGFAGATVQAHSAGVNGPIRTVRIEVISFDEPVGADTYLGWLRTHAEDLFGQVRIESIRDLPVAFVLAHDPEGCCSKEQSVWVAAWRNGTDAIWIRVIGPDVRRGRVGRLVERLQELGMG
jgi:hypothetical protein